MKQAPLIFILYDGINNSVFEGQVLQPLLHKLETGQEHTIYIISFETISTDTIKAYTEQHQHLHVIIAKKIPFIGKASLYYAAYQLKKILGSFQTYKIIARGPLAGFIFWQSIHQERCISFTMQARGLLAAEYAFAHMNEKNLFKKMLHIIRAYQFKKIEKIAYCIKPKISFSIEAVSKALKEYLVNTFNVDETKISIASEDIPKKFSPAHVASHWRTEIRTQLNIPEHAKVYCYSGSIKPWQCPEKIVEFFTKQLKLDNNIFLLILTQDKDQFETLLSLSRISETYYKVMCIAHADVYQYLTACDVGLLFRDPHIINWVSRPTKALEYQAAGLKIEHNSTVSWLIEK